MMLEPWWTACGPMVDLLGDLWAADEQEMGLFAEGPCHHTNVLFEHAAIGSCPPDLLAAWTDDVNAACCQQNGIFECEAGTPWTCDAECAVEFGPCASVMIHTRPFGDHLDLCCALMLACAQTGSTA